MTAVDATMDGTTAIIGATDTAAIVTATVMTTASATEQGAAIAE